MNALNRLPVGYWLLAIAIAFAGGLAVDDVKLDRLSLPNIVTPGPNTPTVETKATAATFCYEKDEHAIPGPVLAALNKLNRERGVVATVLEADTKDGTGEVPDQYKAALTAAKEAGLPALVVTAGDKVLAVVKNPKSEADVIGAVK